MISSLSCALLHPSTPSCSQAFLYHILLSVPPLTRILAIVALAISAVQYKNFLAQPISATNAASKRVIKIVGVLSAAAGSTWGSICLLNKLLPRSALPTKRFFLNGFIGGFPFALLGNSRGGYLSIFRVAAYSAWKVCIKRGLWCGWKGGDLWILVLSWALIGSILDGKPSAIQTKGLRKCLAWTRGEGLVDPVEVAAKRRVKKADTQKKSSGYP